ncbi:HlyD family efflux transporter periplasmic adaptor subunit [Patescibacteria group bacterium]|nr:HlyD family efflux transporter periplasmic adaptor subunit [Patescibacteria group bacterium]
MPLFSLTDHMTSHLRYLTVIFIILSASVVLTGCGTQPDLEQKVIRPKVTAIEIKGGLMHQFSTTGEVTAEKSARITAEFRATVTSINKKAGDQVLEGDSIVTLDAQSVSARLSTANTSYATSYQNVQQTKLTAQKNVESSRIGLESAKSNLGTVLKQNVARKVQAEAALKSSQINLNLSVSSAQVNLEAAISQTSNTVNTALTSMDEIFEYSPEYKDLDNIREVHIGVRDPYFKIEVIEYLMDTYTQFRSYTPSYKSAKQLLVRAIQALDKTLQILRLSVTSPQYTQSQLDSEISKIIGQQATIRTIISQLDSAKSALDLTEQSSGSDSQTLVNARAVYESAMADLEFAEQAAHRRVEEAQIAFENAQASAKISEIGARSALAGTSGELSQARISDDKRNVRSPFAGQVIDIPLNIGDEIQPGTLLVAIENDSLLKIVTYLSAEEVSNVYKGDLVSIENTSEARVSSVSPSADPVSKKYKVEIIHSEKALTPGTLVRLTFTSTSKNGNGERIFAPITSVHINGSEIFVWTLEGSGEFPVTKKSPITIDKIVGEFVEVISGLSAGDVLIMEGGRMLDKEGIEVIIDFEKQTSNIDNTNIESETRSPKPEVLIPKS